MPVLSEFLEEESGERQKNIDNPLPSLGNKGYKLFAPFRMAIAFAFMFTFVNCLCLFADDCHNPGSF